jgi:UDP-2,4-diacetamido-2,4,6-trideoxy-beta-L-altropyranose hydrolase
MKLYIRADASPAIGAGHVMRTLALAQEWLARSGVVTYICAELPAALESRLNDEGISVRRIASAPGSDDDLAATDAITTEDECWVILDGYSFDERWHATLRRPGRRVLCIDDFAQCSSWAVDAIVNPHAYGTPSMYPVRAPGTLVLTGVSALLLRNEFNPDAPPLSPPNDPMATVIVSMGASDPLRLTAAVVGAVRASLGESTRVVAVVGPAASAQLAREVVEADASVEVVRDVSNMAVLMRGADLGVVACGGTIWECIATRLPSIAIRVAENQRRLAEYVGQLGWFPVLDADRLQHELGKALESMKDARARARFVESAATLVPTNPVRGIVDRMEALDFRVRTASERDARILFEWANDADTRRFSIQTEPIEWATHLRWFDDRLKRPSCRFFVVEAPLTGPIAQVRFDLADDGWWVSISLAPCARGRGWAHGVLNDACGRLRAEFPLSTIRATVRVSNAASLALFRRAGFVPVRQVERGGALCDDFELQPVAAPDIPTAE